MVTCIAEYGLRECGSVVESQCATARIFDAGAEHNVVFFLLRLPEISLTEFTISCLEYMACMERPLPEPVARAVVVQSDSLSVTPIRLYDPSKAILVEVG